MTTCAAPFTGCTKKATTTATVRFANGSGVIRVCGLHAAPTTTKFRCADCGKADGQPVERTMNLKGEWRIAHVNGYGCKAG